MDTSQWIDDSVTAWRARGRTVSVTEEEGERGARVASVVISDSVPLDLSLVPVGQLLNVKVSLVRGSRLVLHGLMAGSAVSVRLVSVQGQRQGRLQVSECAGQIRLEDCGVPVVLPRAAGDAELVIGPNAETTVESGNDGTLSVSLDGGALRVDQEFALVRILPGGGSLTSAPAGKIAELSVLGDAAVTLGTGGGGVPIGKIMGRTGAELLTLNLDKPERGSSTTVENIVRVGLRSDHRLRVSNVHTVEDARLVGNVAISCARDATAEGITCVVEKDIPPAIAAGPGSVLTDLSGEVILGTVRGAQLNGNTSGYLIVGIDNGGRTGAARQPETLLANSVLTGFRLPGGLAGRQLLTELEGTYHLDPNTENVPGWDQRVLHSGNITDYARPRSKRILYQDAEFVRELARLAAEKGAPGSSRTRIAWCAYRLRHLKASGMESVALSAYRLLGYGERPIPALLTWLCVSLLAAVIALSGNGPEWSWGGGLRLVEETTRQALGPLSGLMKSGTPAAAEEWHYALRALVAVPLVTGVLAARNYVKSAQR